MSHCALRFVIRIQQAGLLARKRLIARTNVLACPPATGLSLLNISLDTLRPERFEAMTRRRGLHRVLDTLQQAVGLGYDPVKVSILFPRSHPSASNWSSKLLTRGPS